MEFYQLSFGQRKYELADLLGQVQLRQVLRGIRANLPLDLVRIVLRYCDETGEEDDICLFSKVARLYRHRVLRVWQAENRFTVISEDATGTGKVVEREWIDRGAVHVSILRKRYGQQ